jgi:putative thioredoxin
MSNLLSELQPAAAAPRAMPVRDSDTANFKADVIDASKQVPVLVDFWAPWCGPCKQLTPVLEKIVNESNGRVRLVKINVDENQQIAAQLRVQSIPAVFAFVNGQPIDGFMGALPESQVRQFISRLSNKGSMAEEIAAAVAAAEDAFGKKDYETAIGILAQVLGADPGHVAALALLARSQIALDDIDGAKETLAMVPPDKAGAPEIVGAKAALELALNPVDTSIVSTLSNDVAADPDDFAKRVELAVALNAAGRRDEAADHLLYVVKKKRDWNDEAARKQLLQFFEIWGPKDEATLSGRRKLSSLLFA